MALFSNCGVGGSIRVQGRVLKSIERGLGEETTDEGKIKRVASLPELRS